MLTIEELKNTRIRTRRRNRHFIYGTATAFGLLGVLLGSGWLFLPNIVPFLAGSALLIGSPLTVILFGLAGIALGLFTANQLVNLGRSLLHVIHHEKSKRTWLRIGFAVAATALMTILLSTGALPIAATGFASAAIATTIVLSSVALATFLAKHIARGYAYYTSVSKGKDGYTLQIDASTHEAYIQHVTNPYKENFSRTELNNLIHILPRDVKEKLDKDERNAEIQLLTVLRRLNQHVTEAKWAGDEDKELSAKAARDLLHKAAGSSVDNVKAARRFGEFQRYVTGSLTNKAIKHSELTELAKATIRAEGLEAEHIKQDIDSLHKQHNLDYSVFSNPLGYALRATGLYHHHKKDIAKEMKRVKEEWHLDRAAFEPVRLTPTLSKS